MSSSALFTAKKFSTQQDRQHRKNACIALGTIAGRESIRKLVRLALQDRDPAVRERAEAEIVRLGSEAKELVGEVMRETLGDTKLEVPAVALLGRLRDKGISIPPPGNLLARFRRMRRVGEAEDASARSGAWTCLTLSLPASVVMCLAWPVFLMVLVDDPTLIGEDIIGPLLFSFFAASIVMGVVAARGCRGIGSDYDQVASGAFEVWLATQRGIVLSAIFAVLDLFRLVKAQALPDLPGLLVTLLLWACILCTFVVAVRAGTLLGCGIVRRPGPNQVIQFTTGIACGAVATALLTRLAGPPDYDFHASLFYFLFLPAGAVLSFVYARIDRLSIPRRPLAGRVALPIAMVLAASVSVPVLLLLSASAPAGAEEVQEFETLEALYDFLRRKIVDHDVLSWIRAPADPV